MRPQYLLKVFRVAAAGLVLAGLGSNGFSMNLEKAQTFSKLRTSSNVEHYGRLSVSRTNLILGRDFSVARFSSTYKDRDRHTFNSAVVDVVMLIDSLGEAPEAKDLDRVRKQMFDGRSNGTEVSLKIAKIFETYSERQSPNDKWHAMVGSALADLVFGSYHGNVEQVRHDVQRIRRLVEAVPQNAEKDLIKRICSLIAEIDSELPTGHQMEDLVHNTLAIFKDIERN